MVNLFIKYETYFEPKLVCFPNDVQIFVSRCTATEGSAIFIIINEPKLQQEYGLRCQVYQAICLRECALEIGIFLDN